MDKTKPLILDKNHITVLEVLPNGHRWNQYWRDGENLWVGKLPKKMFDTGTDQEIIDDVASFFSLEAYNYTFSDGYVWDSCVWETQLYENFIKTVWLTHDFFSIGFSHRLGCHWNPRSNCISIHPGQGRKRILRLFLQKRDEIDVIFFNTGGFVCDWMENLKPVSEGQLENIVTGKGWWCAFTPDHGTFIPHPINTGISIENNKKEWFEKISSKLTNPNFKIFFDHDIPYLSRWKTKNKREADVVIEGVTHDIPEISKATLTILALTGLTLELEFRGVEYKIQNRNSLNTERKEPLKKENDKNKSFDKPKTNNTVNKITGKIDNGEKYNPNKSKVKNTPSSNEPKKLTSADFISSKKPTNKNNILK